MSAGDASAAMSKPRKRPKSAAILASSPTAERESMAAASERIVPSAQGSRSGQFSYSGRWKERWPFAFA